MERAKPGLDLGLFTGSLDAMRAFYERDLGLRYEESLPTGGGNMQHRFAMNGSVLKVNHPRAGVPQAPPSGLRELWIAREGLVAEAAYQDPDDNRVRLVTPGTEGVVQIGIVLHARDAQRTQAFLCDALGMEPEAPGRLRSGETRILLREAPDATGEVTIQGPGFRYLTLQVFDCVGVHRRALEAGGRELAPPRKMGEVAIFSMVQDPDGNAFEVSQRASLTGPLGDPVS